MIGRLLGKVPRRARTAAAVAFLVVVGGWAWWHGRPDVLAVALTEAVPHVDFDDTEDSP